MGAMRTHPVRSTPPFVVPLYENFSNPFRISKIPLTSVDEFIEKPPLLRVV